MTTPTARRTALLCLLLLSACAALPPQTPGAPAPAPKPLPAAELAPTAPALSSPGEPVEATVATQTAEVVESARASVRSTTVWLARGVDSWFGDRSFDDGGKVTDGQLDLSVLQRRGERADVDARLNARFRLPNIDRLAYVFFGRDNEREVITDKPGALSRQDRVLVTRAQDRAFFAGLGSAPDDAFDFRIGVRGAFKPYAQARMRHRWQLGDNDWLDTRETIFWTVDDRVGSTTAWSYGHAFSPTLAALWLNAATVTQELPKFVWASSIGLYQIFGGQRQLSLESLVNGQQGSGVGALDYGLQVHWEQPVYENWLLGGIVVGHFWPRPDVQTERRRAWALGLSLKMRF